MINALNQNDLKISKMSWKYPFLSKMICLQRGRFSVMEFLAWALEFFAKPNAATPETRMDRRIMARSGKPHPNATLDAHRMDDDGFIIPKISASSIPKSQAAPIAASMMRIHAGSVAGMRCEARCKAAIRQYDVRKDLTMDE